MTERAMESIAGILARRARTTPQALAFRFLLDGELQEDQWSYSRLDVAARKIAAALREQGLSGERVLLLYPPGPDYIAAFFACLYAGAVAVPAYPPDPSRLARTLPRLRAIIADCGAAAALTMESIRDAAAAMLSDIETEQHQPLAWIASDTIATGSADVGPESVFPGDTAFLQYTSGSTTTPRGVMVTHGNLEHNCGAIERRLGNIADFSGVSWLPPYHDMGLIGGILSPIRSGVPITLLSPLDFLQRPVRWLNALTRYRAMGSPAPNFAYDLCVRKITADQRAHLDLSSWRVTFNGAEPIDPGTLDRFVATFGPCGFRRETFLPCYGLAEGTLISTGIDPEAVPTVREFQSAGLAAGRVESATPNQERRSLVGSGRPIEGQTVDIVDPKTCRRCPPGQVGEIWLSGPSIARGYWNRPEQTAATFQARIADDNSGPYMRTGDLGALVDGELFVTGRIKDLIIVAGANHYPQDIERTVEGSHPSVRAGASAAFAISVEGHERLVITCETDEPGSTERGDEIRRTIRRAVAEVHQLPAHAVVLIKRGGIPRTSSGKIQRHACRDAFVAGTLDSHAA